MNPRFHNINGAFVIRSLDGKRDAIRDLEVGTDLIDLRRWEIGFSDLALIDKTPGRVRIEIDGEALIVRDGGKNLLTASDLGADDFLFLGHIRRLGGACACLHLLCRFRNVYSLC